MKMRRPISFALVIAIVLFTLTVASAAAVGVNNGWFAQNDDDNSTIDNNSVKYEKPAIGDIARDGAYPDEKKSSSSEVTKEKVWYEYLTYSTEPIAQIITDDGNAKILAFDPFDYSNGLIMKVENTITYDLSAGLSSGSYIKDHFTEVDSYSSANAKTIAYSKSVSKSHSNDYSFSFEVEEEIEISSIEIFSLRLKESFGISFGYNETSSLELSVSETYNAIYFNSQGVPYQWKVVHYTVYLPLKCKIQRKNADGAYIDTNEVFYYLCPTIQGTCREYIKNNTVYMEHWGTGESVAVENFWKDFYDSNGTRNGIQDDYKSKMTPTNY